MKRDYTVTWGIFGVANCGDRCFYLDMYSLLYLLPTAETLNARYLAIHKTSSGCC